MIILLISRSHSEIIFHFAAFVNRKKFTYFLKSRYPDIWNHWPATLILEILIGWHPQNPSAMKSTYNSHIYIYDRERNEVVVIDSQTGEEIERREDHLTSILDYLRDKGWETEMRKFAVWCARQTDTEWKPLVYKIFEKAEQAIHNKADREQLRALYEETEGEAVSSDTVKLQIESRKAATFLAARACINPDPFQAALEASRYHKLWAELDFKDQQHELPEEDLERAAQEVQEKADQQQVDHLLDLISKKLDV